MTPEEAKEKYGDPKRNGYVNCTKCPLQNIRGDFSPCPRFVPDALADGYENCWNAIATEVAIPDRLQPLDKYSIHKRLCDGLNELYRTKNEDYGDTFGEGFKEYGLIMPVIRLEDKFKRFKQLATGAEQKVKDESIIDTLRDLANYALMTVVELEVSNAAEKPDA